MPRFVKASVLASAVLFVAGACFAQDKQGVAGSKDMWAQYKKMWVGEWVTTHTTQNGDEIRGEMTIEPIVDGKAVLITRTWRMPTGDAVQKALGSWCPKKQAIVLNEVSTYGTRTEVVLKLVDGEERGVASHVNEDGTEDSSRTIATAVDDNTRRFKMTEGRFEGVELTWKRKKG